MNTKNIDVTRVLTLLESTDHYVRLIDLTYKARLNDRVT